MSELVSEPMDGPSSEPTGRPTGGPSRDLEPHAAGGVLDVRKKAIESIVLHAATAVPGTVRVGGMMQRLRRGTYPSASVTLRGGRAWVELDVAATWPCAAERLADNVRRQVYTEASDLSSVPIERLDVTLHVVDAAESGERR